MIQSNLKLMPQRERQQSRAGVARPKLRRHGNTAKGRSARVRSNVDCRFIGHTSARPILESLRARGLRVSRSRLRAGDESSAGTSILGALNRGVFAAMKG